MEPLLRRRQAITHLTGSCFLLISFVHHKTLTNLKTKQPKFSLLLQGDRGPAEEPPGLPDEAHAGTEAQTQEHPQEAAGRAARGEAARANRGDAQSSFETCRKKEQTEGIIQAEHSTVSACIKL